MKEFKTLHDTTFIKGYSDEEMNEELDKIKFKLFFEAIKKLPYFVKDNFYLETREDFN